jgi:hypothetical protein
MKKYKSVLKKQICTKNDIFDIYQQTKDDNNVTATDAFVIKQNKTL